MAAAVLLLLAGGVGLAPRTEAKAALLRAIRRYDEVKAETPTDGVVVDFGARGGELDPETRRPQNIVQAMAQVSPALAAAAEDVLAKAEVLEALNPTADATRFMGTAEGELCPLHGVWALAFTTAADASFSAKSARGSAVTSQRVDAVRGRIVNQIDFTGPDAALSQLRVVIHAAAQSPATVGLRFRYAWAHVRRLARLRLWRPVPIYVPLAALFAVARVAVAVSRLLMGRARPPPQQPFFEVTYLDGDLRCHRTGEGNLFVQRRPAGWSGHGPGREALPSS